MSVRRGSEVVSALEADYPCARGMIFNKRMWWKVCECGKSYLGNRVPRRKYRGEWLMRLCVDGERAQRNGAEEGGGSKRR